jgi:hypothetical protein
MDLVFRVVKVCGPRDEELATARNALVARAAFDVSVSLWPEEEIELRHGTRVVAKSK